MPGEYGVEEEVCSPLVVSQYAVHGGTVSSLFSPDETSMANVAHFMCELVTNPKAWDDWKGRLPVIINAPAS